MHPSRETSYLPGDSFLTLSRGLGREAWETPALQRLFFNFLSREVLNGVGVDGVGVIFLFFCAFSPFF